MTTIASLNYRLGLDTRGFVEGATYAKGEWNKLNRVFGETRTEAEKTSAKLLMLDEAVKKGQISAKDAAETQRRIIEASKASEIVGGGEQGGFQLPDISKRLAPIALAGTAIAGVTAGLYAARTATSELVEMMAAARKQIDDANDSAQTIGVTLGQLQGFQFAGLLDAGANAEKSAAGLQKLVVNIGKAAEDDGKENVFTKLGLDAKKLSAESPQKALEAIADAVAKVDDPYRRAAIGSELFGKANVDLVKSLANGAEGLRAASERASELGIVLSSFDAERVAAANDAVDEMNLALQGMKNIIAVELSPVIQVLANEATAFITSFKIGAEESRGPLDTLARSILVMTGSLIDGTTAMVKITEAIALTAAGSPIAAAQKLIESQEALAEQSSGRLIHEYELAQAAALTAAATREKELDAIREAELGAGQLADAAKAEVDACEEANKEWERKEKLIEDANKRVEQETQSLKEQVEQAQINRLIAEGADAESVDRLRLQLGLTAEINRLKKEGVTPENIAALEQARKEAEIYKKQAEDAKKQTADDEREAEKRRAEAEKIKDSIRTPSEIVQEEIEKYNDLLSRGLLTQSEYAKASLNAVKQANKTQAQAPSSVSFGSTEAYKLVAQLQSQRTSEELDRLEVDKAIEEASRQTAENTQRMAERLQQIEAVAGVA